MSGQGWRNEGALERLAETAEGDGGECRYSEVLDLELRADVVKGSPHGLEGSEAMFATCAIRELSDKKSMSEQVRGNITQADLHTSCV